MDDVATGSMAMSSVEYDRASNTTALVPAGMRGTGDMASLTKTKFSGLKLGLIKIFFNHTPTPEKTAVNNATAKMTSLLCAPPVLRLFR